MSPEMIATFVSALALCIAVYAIYRAHQAGQAITGDYLTATLQEATATATELTEVALVAVQASEQLYRTGRIQKGERLDKAFSYVKRWFPDLDQATIVTAIEAGVLVVNTLVDAIPSKRGPAPMRQPDGSGQAPPQPFSSTLTGRQP